MARLLFRVAEHERGKPFAVCKLLTNVSDDSMVYLLSGEMSLGSVEGEKSGRRTLTCVMPLPSA